jgi:hypothetical protein
MTFSADGVFHLPCNWQQTVDNLGDYWQAVKSSWHCILCSMLIGNGFIGYLLPFTRCFIWCLVTVTSYYSFCLQDIVENEDIKLDMMFMASLVHDLIKVGRLKQRMMLAESS